MPKRQKANNEAEIKSECYRLLGERVTLGLVGGRQTGTISKVNDDHIVLRHNGSDKVWYFRNILSITHLRQRF